MGSGWRSKSDRGRRRSGRCSWACALAAGIVLGCSSPQVVGPSAVPHAVAGDGRVTIVRMARQATTASETRVVAVRMIRERQGGVESLLVDLRLENHGKRALALCTRPDFLLVELRHADGSVRFARLKEFEDKWPMPDFRNLAILPPGHAALFTVNYGEQDRDLSGVEAFRARLKPYDWDDERSKREIRSRKAETLDRDRWSAWTKAR